MAKWKSFSTRAVHAGERSARPDFTPVSTPIYQTVGYIYEDLGELDRIFGNERAGYVYARYGSPTNAALEEALANLEEAEAAVAFGSGMAALYASLLASGIQQGSSLLMAQDVYGATYSLGKTWLRKMGVRVEYFDPTNREALARCLAEVKPQAILLETVSNPLLKVADIPQIVAMAHQRGAKVIVDNTFATPFLFRPIRWEADFSVHSTTKYIGGHGDVLGGAVVTSRFHRDTLHEILKMTGGNLGPLDAWLTLRGLKTLPLRMKQHCHNAMEVAQWLSSNPRIGKVNYPGLPTHPQHELSRRLFPEGLFGGMISFEIKDAGRREIFRFLGALELILPATTLGDVYSLILYPAMSSHRALTAEERARLGIPDNMVRLSVGIEDASEIIEDLDRALERIT